MDAADGGADEIGEALARHSPRWSGPARRWADGALLGNGTVGVVVWGDGHPLVIDLDHTSAWDRRSPAVVDRRHHRYADFRVALTGAPSDWDPGWPVWMPRLGDATPTRLPPSRLEVDLPEGAVVSGMVLDLERAEVRVAVEGGDGSAELRVVVPRHVDGCLVERSCPARVRFVPCSQPEAWDRAVPTGSPDPAVLFADYDALRRTAGPDAEHWVQPVPDGSALAWVLRRDDAGSGWVAVGIAARRDDPDGAVAAAAAADAAEELADGRSAVVERHRGWWRHEHRRSWVRVGDERLEALWCRELTKLTMATTADGDALALCGPWSPDGRVPPWGGDLHHNVNVQMSYAPALVAGRPELVGSLRAFVQASLPEWRRLATELFGAAGADAAFVPSATDDGGRCRYEWATVNLALSSGPWLGHELWRLWRHTGDEAFRRQELVPLLRALAAGALAVLERGDDGRLHVPAGYSPELTPAGGPSWGPDPTCDLELVRWLFTALAEVTAIDGGGGGDTDGAESARWAGLAAEVADPAVDPVVGPLGAMLAGCYGGLRVRADLALVRSHRHHSHLMGLHPLRRLAGAALDDPDGPDAAMVAESLRNLAFRGTGEWVGFSFVWAASLVAHAGRGELARSLLVDYVERWTTAGSLHVQGSEGRALTVWDELADLFGGDALSLEAGFGAAAAVQDLLLQDHGDVVRLFPALPISWPAASFAGLHAEGGWTVAASVEGGVLVGARVLAERGGRLELRWPDPGPPLPLVVDGAASGSVGGGRCVVEVAAGAEVVLGEPASSPTAPPTAPSG